MSNGSETLSGFQRREGLAPMTVVEPVLFLCFFLSGASSLVYEVVWLRWLVHLFGVTTLAVSTVLTAFMGGLAVGSWAAGRWAPRVTYPLRVYGLLELAIGAYALLLPLLLEEVVPTLRALGATEASSFATLSLARFVLASALLTVPTACMGATLPILAQFAVRRLESAGGRVGRLYAVNTAGAVVGAAAAGFVLLPTVGVGLTNGVAVALNAAVGLTAISVGWQLAAAAMTGLDPAPAGVGGPHAQPGGGEVEAGARPLLVAGLGTAALSGALAMAYEVAWTRALSLVLGSSVYAFTVILTTFLFGLAAGSYLLARRVDRMAEPALGIGLTQLLIGVSAFGGLLVVQELPYLFVRLFALSGDRYALLLALEFTIASALILIPALLSGAVFPLCVRLTASPGAAVGRTVGNLYALNTLGAIVGSFAGGFVLIPAVGVRGTLMLAVLLNIAAAFLLLVMLPVRRRAIALSVAGGLPLLALLIPAVTPEWEPLTMASGVAVSAPGLRRLSRTEFLDLRRRSHSLFYEEGLTTTVSVEERAGQISLRVNGKVDAGTGADMPTQILLGHLPTLFHPAPRDLLVIGLGGGVTAGSALRHPVRTVTVVELERAVVTASHFFDHVNLRPFEDPRTRLVVNDARNFLLLTRDRFDVIISEPSNPWMTGASSLFTREFFELARERLRPGGIFGQWVHLYSLTPGMLRTIFSTFNAVFPHAAVFQTTQGDTVLVGGTSPLRVDLAGLERRLAEPGVAADLRRAHIEDPADLLARLVLDVEDVPRFIRGAPLNTDDNASIEFAAPRALYVDTTLENWQRLADTFTGNGGVLRQLAPDPRDGFLAALGERLLKIDRPQQANAVAMVALKAGPQADFFRIAARAAEAVGETAEAERRWQAALAADPGHPGVLVALAAHLQAHGDVNEARGLFRRVGGRGGPEVQLRVAELLYRLGDYRDAEALLRRLPPDLPGVGLTLGLTRLALGDAASAERLFQKSLERHDDARARAGLAAALDLLDRPVKARRERQRALELDEGEARRLILFARAREKVGHLRWAEHDLRRARDLMPWNLEVHEEHARLLERMGARHRAIEAWEETFRTFPRYALALLEVARLWEAEGDQRRALEAVRRYIAAEPDLVLRQRVEEALKRQPAPPR